MKLTSRVLSVITSLLVLSCTTSCDNNTSNKTIPAVNEESINEAAESLGVSIESFETYLANIETTYDNYIENLNQSNQSLDDLKTKIEETYGCTFQEYIDTVITVNNKNIPDDKEYNAFKSIYSVFDAYIPTKELNDNTLINYDIDIEIADKADDAWAFDVMQTCDGDFRLYLDIMNQRYGCKSVEFTNMAIFGGHGVTKPEEDNPCMDSFFVYDAETDEILEQLTVSVLTMRYSDESKNVTLALSNELGLLFKSTGADSAEKMLKLSNLHFQVRKADHE